MTAALMLVFVNLLGTTDAPPADDAAILCCEQRSTRLLLLDANTDWSDPRAIRWSWSPDEADDIEPAHRPWFRYLTDGKRVLGGTHLITSASGGGIALIRMKDKRVVFYALADGNTHSIEILPDGNLVSASSTGNYLRVFSTDPAAGRFPKNAKHTDTKLEDAHGVTWDHERQRLWAVGGVDLVRYRYNGDRQNPALTEDARFKLPNRGGGHDLFPVPGTRRLFVTGGWIWTFDTETEKFADFPSRLQHGVKSISQREPGGPTLLMVATESWWSDTLRFVNEDRKKQFPQARFYKARWWVPNPFSYGPEPPPSAPASR
jgi:hypothetical protein